MNHELLTALGARPVIPSSVQEAKLGWDAEINWGSGWVYHLQYKVSYFTGKPVWNNTKYWDHHGGPYYRFGLLTDKLNECGQHRQLVQLSEEGTSRVFYCAPEFHGADELWDHAKAGTVTAHSTFLDPKEHVPASYTAPHTITYGTASTAPAKPKIWSDVDAPEGRAYRIDDLAKLKSSPLNHGSLAQLAWTMIDVGARGATDKAQGLQAPVGRRENLLNARLWSDRPDDLNASPRPRARANDDDSDRTVVKQSLASMADRELVDLIARLGILDFGAMTYLRAGDQ